MQLLSKSACFFGQCQMTMERGRSWQSYRDYQNSKETALDSQVDYLDGFPDLWRTRILLFFREHLDFYWFYIFQRVVTNHLGLYGDHFCWGASSRKATTAEMAIRPTARPKNILTSIRASFSFPPSCSFQSVSSVSLVRPVGQRL